MLKTRAYLMHMIKKDMIGLDFNYLFDEKFLQD